MYRGRKKYMNGRNFLLRRFSFSSVIHHQTFTFSVHRTYATGDIMFFICHETTYDHVIKESCDFVRGDPLS